MTRETGRTILGVQCMALSFPKHFNFKGKGTQKYKWILSKCIWSTAHFDANCMEIEHLLLKIVRFYVLKWPPMEAAILN